MKQPINQRVLQDAHKIAFLAKEYPDKTIKEIAGMFQGSPLDFNVAAWQAQDLNFLTVDLETGNITPKQLPEKWDFGPDTQNLIDVLPYVFVKLAEQESDMEENYLSNWAAAYPAQALMIAIKYLIGKKVLATYEITNSTTIEPSKKGLKRGKQPKVVKDTYTFYSLAINAKHQWGRKQFKDQDKLEK